MPQVHAQWLASRGKPGTGVAWISANPGPQSTASRMVAVLYLLAVVAICP